jgi:hypothetical protein
MFHSPPFYLRKGNARAFYTNDQPGTGRAHAGIAEGDIFCSGKKWCENHY